MIIEINYIKTKMEEISSLDASGHEVMGEGFPSNGEFQLFAKVLLMQEIPQSIVEHGALLVRDEDKQGYNQQVELYNKFINSGGNKVYGWEYVSERDFLNTSRIALNAFEAMFVRAASAKGGDLAKIRDSYETAIAAVELLTGR